ncbi:Acyl-coenzyme A oxidase 2 peroxisomal [Zea mays]|uniref:acyl-CoA oxidase n=1 Tax=Zea mays TaxID=4577 RepID=A0A1D6EBD9_MAIZE|nr:Acyl-coenzyme A oxidase 2 peroxisomal [Zea mays]
MATGSVAGEESSAAARRLRRLSLHLLQPAPADHHHQPLALAACGHRVEGGTDVAAALAAYLRGRHRSAQMRLFDFFRAHPDLQTPIELPTAAHRDLCYRQLRTLVREAGVRPLTLMATDPAEYFAVMEAAGGADISLGVKLGVQYSLWGGSVINLGTKKHRDKYGIDNLDYPGSNVQALQTTATFDHVTDEFIINTPNDGAIKWWIGNAALHGKFATVFARLILPLQGKGGEAADMGIHAFIVPIRDLETHAVLPGIEINDCGHKIGLNGVDNGALRFRSVRIPRDNLLNRFGDVSRDGKYTSSLPTINKRFAATLGELVGGRVGIAYCSVGVLKVAVTIVVRYALLRHQFGPPKQPEISVLDYQSHQHKLMPMLASSYAFHFATVQLVDKYSEMKKTNDEDLIADVHVLSSGLKAYITSYTAKSISQKHSKTLGGFGAWNRCLNHLLTLESHIESVILAKFIESVKSCPDEKSREVLKLVCDLYALDRIWQDIGTYIRYVAGGGWMTGVSIRRSFLLSNFLNTARHRITNRQQVFDLGIGRYNETCHNIVTKYISEWEAMVTRARRWIDFKNDYKTMNLNFM